MCLVGLEVAHCLGTAWHTLKAPPLLACASQLCQVAHTTWHRMARASGTLIGTPCPMQVTSSLEAYPWHRIA